MKEVAKLAGVSVPAVSKVLHGTGSSIRVSESKAEEIRNAARQLQYTPNALAQSLRSNRTNTIGLIFEHFGSIAAGPLYYVHLFDGIVQELFAHHYRLSILPEVDLTRPLATLADGRLDGVIWCKMPSSPDFLSRISTCPIPIVALNAPPLTENLESMFISCDNHGGAELVVEHLRGLGHKRILFAMERYEETTPDAIARLNGFRRACIERGFPCGEDDVVVWSSDAREFPAWWAARPEQTAIFAWNEGLGASILRRASRSGIEVPRELSVCGFDSTQFCESTFPRLTAARQPIREMAGYAAKAIVNLIEGHLPTILDVSFPCTLDVRDSTAPPKEHRTSQS